MMIIIGINVHVCSNSEDGDGEDDVWTASEEVSEYECLSLLSSIINKWSK